MPLLDSLTGGAPVAALLLVTMVVFSLVALFVRPELLERNLFRPYWLLPRREFASVITSGFLHADLGHLFFNAFSFWAFGFSLERAIGSPAFTVLYFVGLLVSDISTWVQHRHNPNYRSLGASGAISAVLFASILYFPTASIFIMPIPVPIPAPIFAVSYLAYTVYMSRQAGGRVNHDAHLGGALAGIAFVALTDAPTLGRAWQAFFG